MTPWAWAPIAFWVALVILACLAAGEEGAQRVDARAAGCAELGGRMLEGTSVCATPKGAVNFND